MMKFTKKQIEIVSRHGAERAQMVAEQANARAELEERQQKELEAAGIHAQAQPMLHEPPARKVP